MKNIYRSLTFILTLLSFNSIAQETDNFDQDVSIRNKEMSHYHDMMSWEDSTYREFAYWSSNSNGSIIDFMNFRVMFPEGYDKNSDTKYPTTVMLHGAGESGRKWTNHFEYDPTDPRYDNNGHQLLIGGKAHRDAILDIDEAGRKFPGIAIFPQCSYNGAWTNGNLVMLTKIIEYMIREYDVDPYRIYLHGLSNGGKGTWDYATLRPDLFAALLPIAGVGKDKNASTDTLVTTPMWVFQGGNDANPSPEWTEQWINDLIAKGGNPKYTEYEGLTHDPTLYKAYEEQDFFSWMLQFNKKDIYTFSDAPECVNSENTVKLGFSAGYLGYQWKRDGNPIAGANSRYYTATLGGTYTVEFKQPIDSNWVESNEIFLDGVSTGDQPAISVNGSAAQPLPSGSDWDNSLSLTVPDTLFEYRWYKNGTLINGAASSELTINEGSSNVAANEAGVYTLEYGQESNCATNVSLPLEIVYTDPQPTNNPPTGLNAAATSESEISLEWNDTNYETSYEVWARVVDTYTDNSGFPGTKYKLVSKLEANSSSLALQDLRIGTTNEFKVRAIRTDGSATFSESVTATIEDTSPPTVPSLQVDSIAETLVVLSWEAASDNDYVYSYEIYQDGIIVKELISDSLDYNPTEGIPAPPTSVTIDNLEKGTVYEFSIQALDYARNMSGESELLSVETARVLSDRIPIDKEYLIYPNPTNGPVQLISKNEQLDQTRTTIIYNLSGAHTDSQKTIQFVNGVATMDLSYLPKGYYLIKLDNSTYPVIKK
ncbi:MAG: fibronectin type III domain-containing protein [Marinoscillum sp.]